MDLKVSFFFIQFIQFCVIFILDTTTSTMEGKILASGLFWMGGGLKDRIMELRSSPFISFSIFVIIKILRI